MYKSNLIAILCIPALLISVTMGQSFELQQLRYSRVRTAFTEKQNSVKALFHSAKLKFPAARIYIRIHKYEQELELWAAEKPDDVFKLVSKYKFCASSGDLGPKRQQGDFQTPEGFYHIDRFNPTSNFYLSLGLNYPNTSDQILGTKGNLGGDIFIHGDCVTIGCVPLTDDKIKELYLIAVKAKSMGQIKIPVHVFPYNFSNRERKKQINAIPAYHKYAQFWSDLEQGHHLFDISHKLPKVKVDPDNGRYLISQIRSATD